MRIGGTRTDNTGREFGPPGATGARAGGARGGIAGLCSNAKDERPGATCEVAGLERHSANVPPIPGGGFYGRAGGYCLYSPQS